MTKIRSTDRQTWKYRKYLYSSVGQCLRMCVCVWVVQLLMPIWRIRKNWNHKPYAQTTAPIECIAMSTIREFIFNAIAFTHLFKSLLPLQIIALILVCHNTLITSKCVNHQSILLTMWIVSKGQKRNPIDSERNEFSIWCVCSMNRIGHLTWANVRSRNANLSYICICICMRLWIILYMESNSISLRLCVPRVEYMAWHFTWYDGLLSLLCTCKSRGQWITELFLFSVLYRSLSVMCKSCYIESICPESRSQ